MPSFRRVLCIGSRGTGRASALEAGRESIRRIVTLGPRLLRLNEDRGGELVRALSISQTAKGEIDDFSPASSAKETSALSLEKPWGRALVSCTT